MYLLENNELIVRVLDPLTDRARLGSRYCTGGYVWQVAGRDGRELLAGPQFPEPDPDPFNGQGLPEAFETALGHNDAAVGDEVLVIGVGTVLRSSPVSPFHVRDNPSVRTFCDWDVCSGESALSMRTHQRFRGWEFELTRELSLRGRCLESLSRIVNVAAPDLPVRWFAHPFFPHTPDLVCCKFSVPVEIPDPTGFSIQTDGALEMDPDYNWEKGCYRRLRFKPLAPISVRQHHPALRSIDVECRFPVADLPVWANQATFSFEPYFDTVVRRNGQAQWSIEYRFGL